MTAMFTEPTPPANRWFAVPAGLLPPDTMAAYIHPLNYMHARAHTFEPPAAAASLPPSSDTRPVTVGELPSPYPEECPVCFERPDGETNLWDNPQNSDVPSRCNHYCCCDCWQRVANGDQRCPICRTNISQWLQRYRQEDSEDAAMSIATSESGDDEDDLEDNHPSLCENCDGYFTVVWYVEPYITTDGRRLSSACARCCRELGLRFPRAG